MTLLIDRLELGDPGYDEAVTNLVKVDVIPATLVRVSAPVLEPFVFTKETVERIALASRPLLANQQCLQFKSLTDASCFFHKKGNNFEISGDSLVHLYAHFLLGRIRAQDITVGLRVGAPIVERIYRSPHNSCVLCIVFLADFDMERFHEIATRSWEQLLEKFQEGCTKRSFRLRKKLKAAV